MAGALLIEFPTGIMINGRGRKSVAIYGIIILGIDLILISLSDTLVELVAGIFLFAIGYNMISAPVRLLLYEESDAKKKGRTSSLNLVAVSAGGILGLTFSAALNLTYLPTLYIGLSAVILIIGIIIKFSLKGQKHLALESPQWTGFRQSLKGVLSQMSVLKRIMRKDGFLRQYIVIQVLLSLCWGSSLVFLPAFALELGLNTARTFLLFAGTEISTVASALTGGYLADRFPKYLFFVFRPLSVLIPFLVLAASDSILALVVGVISVETAYFFAPGNRVFVYDQYGDQERAMASSSVMFITHVIGVVSPLLGFLLWEISPRTLFTTDVFVSLLAFLISLLVVKKIFKLTTVSDLSSG